MFLGSGKTLAGAGKNALSVHLSQEPESPQSPTCAILHRAQEVLRTNFGIDHATIQIEQCSGVDCPEAEKDCGSSLHTSHSFTRSRKTEGKTSV